jgi:hypothetical protein
MVNRDFRFGGPPSMPPGSANLQVRIDVEERAGALGVAMPFRVQDAKDDRGRTLKPPEGMQQQLYVSRFDARRQIAAFVPVGLPEADAKAIARLEFVVPVLLPTEVYEAEIQGPAAGSEAGAGTFGVTVVQWKDGNERRHVELLITRPQVTTAAPLQGGTLLTDDVVSFFTADGIPVVPDAPAIVPAAMSVSYTASLPASPPVATIRVSCLKAYEIAELPVVFENVPLP